MFIKLTNFFSENLYTYYAVYCFVKLVFDNDEWVRQEIRRLDDTEYNFLFLFDSLKRQKPSVYRIAKKQEVNVFFYLHSEISKRFSEPVYGVFVDVENVLRQGDIYKIPQPPQFIDDLLQEDVANLRDDGFNVNYLGFIGEAN
ncbi:MAG: hypothetical protein ABIC91_00610 [Nanoarchaeota archaeon]|nr:hypothetical protein [Nanoarchaeota archaeon]MBU1029736.1 hypothetical protein [Nanoarchaeota archaeon]MBU1849165.1 hypothetical protein [Nanoarchaeota archaeon]